MSTTLHNLPSLGSNLAQGTASVADGNTINTGLAQVGGFIATSENSNVVISNRSSSGGVVTVGVFAAGVLSASEQTVDWIAWTNKKV
jgi:hypothetical protein